MKRVVERCPNCGVEHDDPKGGACEVCGTTLRYWCRVHSKEIGWLDAPACPRCAAEAEAAARPRPAPPPAPAEAPQRRPPIVVEPAPPEWTPAPGPEPAPYAGRDPRDVLRDRAEEIGPYVVTGAGMALRLFRAVLAVVRLVIVWGIVGAVIGGGIASYQGADVVWSALFGAMIGGGAGLFFGLIAALRILFSRPRVR